MLNLEAVSKSIDAPEVRSLIKDLGVPARPSALLDVQTELRRDEPRMPVLAQIVASDVAMSGALLKVANSPWMGLSRQAETIQQAFMLLGATRCEQLLMEIALRNALPAEGPALVRFWDVSSKRSQAMWSLAPRVGLQSALAQTVGLFADVGIPLLVKRFQNPSYLETLSQANRSDECFTTIEQARHQTDHAIVGALLARSWGVSQTATLAIRLHHDYDLLKEAQPAEVADLVALCLVVEHIIQRFQGLNQHDEWAKGGEAAMRVLALSSSDVESWCDDLFDQFAVEG
ncbi:MAG: HDOD domain-containing protein [Burkholderiales bacterium]|nr:HDOD domain-containing protein [Burkholderiales bacterium]